MLPPHRFRVAPRLVNSRPNGSFNRQGFRHDRAARTYVNVRKSAWNLAEGIVTTERRATGYLWIAVGTGWLLAVGLLVLHFQDERTPDDLTGLGPPVPG
jgi:hypothetical protein